MCVCSICLWRPGFSSSTRNLTWVSRLKHKWFYLLSNLYSPKVIFLVWTQVLRLAQAALCILSYLPRPLWLWFSEWLCEGHSSNTPGIMFLLASLEVGKRLSSICLSATIVTAFPSNVPNIPWLRTANSLARFPCQPCLYVWQKPFAHRKMHAF